MAFKICVACGTEYYKYGAGLKTSERCRDCRTKQYRQVAKASGSKRGREVVRAQVRKRDNYTCQDCGLVRTPEMVWKHNRFIVGLKGRMRSLDVHHLGGLCGFKTMAYDRKADMHKLITLCHKCHFNQPDFNGLERGTAERKARQDAVLIP